LAAPHPTYPNPTIIQVTCEIAFTPQTEGRLSAGSLYPIFAAEFPEIAPVGVGTIQFVLGPQPFAPAVSEQPQDASAFRFSTSSGSQFVQVSKAGFVYQTNEPYTGWADFSKKLIELWEKSSATIRPGPVVKVGLRYVNRIPKSEDHPSVGDWLQVTPDVPEALLTSKEHFLGRVESSPAPAHLRLVTIANAIPTPECPDGAIVLDIDRVSTEQFEVSTPAISDKLATLHEDVWNAFNAAATDLLKAHLSGKNK
jgi:uncharacterized protein (TIGR04255 family)